MCKTIRRNRIKSWIRSDHFGGALSGRVSIIHGLYIVKKLRVDDRQFFKKEVSAVVRTSTFREVRHHSLQFEFQSVDMSFKVGIGCKCFMREIRKEGA